VVVELLMLEEAEQVDFVIAHHYQFVEQQDIQLQSEEEVLLVHQELLEQKVLIQI
jgi:hypothetical protein